MLYAVFDEEDGAGFFNKFLTSTYPRPLLHITTWSARTFLHVVVLLQEATRRVDVGGEAALCERRLRARHLVRKLQWTDKKTCSTHTDDHVRVYV